MEKKIISADKELAPEQLENTAGGLGGERTATWYKCRNCNCRIKKKIHPYYPCPNCGAGASTWVED